MANQTAEREHFGSKLGVIMASAGSAIGLGNIWKFPYEAGKNGGAAFIIIYLTCIIAIGLALMLAEYVIGRRGGMNAVGSFRKLAPKSAWWLTGMVGVLAATIVLAFYGVVAGWTLEYLFQAIANSFADRSPDALEAQFDAFIKHPIRPLLWQLLFMGMTCALILSGIRKGIERYTEILMPLLFIVILVLAVRSVTLPGGGEGIKFIFQPDFSKINGQTVLNALGLAFFSLSLGFGAIITYGSYIKKNDNLISTSIEVVVLDTVIALLAGLVIFPAVFAYGIAPESGPSLVFITLPNVFQQMPGGMLWGILFFLLLSVAALTSSVSLLEVVTAYISEELKIKRRNAVFIATGIIAAIGVLCSLSKGNFDNIRIAGLNLFAFLDQLSFNILLPLTGMLTALFVGWKMKKAELWDELSNGGVLKIKAFNLFRFSLRWIVPLVILLVLLNKTGVFKYLEIF